MSKYFDEEICASCEKNIKKANQIVCSQCHKNTKRGKI